MKIRTLSLLTIVLSFSINSSLHAEGGGAVTSDGYPSKDVQYVELREIPNREKIQALLAPLAADFPTLTFHLIQAIDLFPNSENRTQLGVLSPDFKIYQVKAKHPYKYSSFIYEDDSSWKETAYPQKARIFLYQDYDALPLQTQDQSPSQVRAILHELTHILITHHDEELTLEIADLISDLALQIGNKNQIKSRLATLLADFNRVTFSYMKVREDLEKDISAMSESVLKTYLQAIHIQHICDDFTESTPIDFFGNLRSFPIAPRSFVSKIDQDHQFFRFYRNYCFSKTPEGRTFIDALPRGFVTYSEIFPKFWSYLTQSTLPLEIEVTTERSSHVYRNSENERRTHPLRPTLKLRSYCSAVGPSGFSLPLISFNPMKPGIIPVGNIPGVASVYKKWERVARQNLSNQENLEMSPDQESYGVRISDDILAFAMQQLVAANRSDIRVSYRQGAIQKMDFLFYQTDFIGSRILWADRPDALAIKEMTRNPFNNESLRYFSDNVVHFRAHTRRSIQEYLTGSYPASEFGLSPSSVKQSFGYSRNGLYLYVGLK